MKSISFIEELQREVVARHKTETRRLTDPQPNDYLFNPRGDFILPNGSRADLLVCSHLVRPRYKVGEIIYIKEPYINNIDPDRVFYKYDPADIQALQDLGYGEYLDKPGFWRNKQSMPAQLARHFLRITARHGERLQDITDDGCKKEGIFSDALECNFGLPNIQCTGLATVLGKSWRDAYASLIDLTYREGTWRKNPFVWVYEFEIVPELTKVERRFYGLK